MRFACLFAAFAALAFIAPHAEAQTVYRASGYRVYPSTSVPSNPDGLVGAGRVGIWSPKTGPYALKPLWHNTDGTDSLMSGGAISGYATVANSGVSLTQRLILNFDLGLTCVDNSGASRTDCILDTSNPNTWSGAQTFRNTMLRVNNTVNDAYSTVESAASVNRIWTLPDATDTAVGLAATQTLTNKTLTAPVLGGTVTGTYTIGGTPTLGAGILNAYHQYGAAQTETDNGLVDGATITINLETSSSASVTLAGSRTIAFSNMHSGSNLMLALIQGGGGSNTITWPGAVHWLPDGTAPTLTTTVGKVDVISCHSFDGSVMQCTALLNGTP